MTVPSDGVTQVLASISSSCSRLRVSMSVPRHDSAESCLEEAHHTRIAGQAPCALAGERRTVLQLRAAGGCGVGEHVGIHMHDDVIPLAAGA